MTDSLIERCEHHGDDFVLYCKVCTPSREELIDEIKRLKSENRLLEMEKEGITEQDIHETVLPPR